MNSEKMAEDYCDIMTSAARELRKPAGDSDRFADLESIRENYDAYICEVHKTWKKWHGKAIEEILFFDSMAAADRKRPIGEVFSDWTNYMRQLWRRVSDSIVWLMADEDRHYMKRLCLYRPRGPLTEANPESVFRTMGLLNADPYSIAIWNDATSGIDVGDITFFSKRTEEMTFLELKEGAVNAEITALNESANDSEYQERFKNFVNKYGVSGIEQLKRIERQSQRNEQILELLKTEQGLDPVTGSFIKIRELATLDEYYDDELRDLLTQVGSDTKEGYRVIDDSLWIYANKDRSLSVREVTERFQKILEEKEPRFELLFKMRRSPGDIPKTVSINAGFNVPASRPLFLRHLEPEQIGEIAYGPLNRRVLLCLDWEKFGQLINEAGAEFFWSTQKQARRERAEKWSNRSSTIAYGRMPLFRVGEATGSVSGAALIRIMFDGIRPKTLANQLVETLQMMLKESESQV